MPFGEPSPNRVAHPPLDLAPFSEAHLDAAAALLAARHRADRAGASLLPARFEAPAEVRAQVAAALAAPRASGVVALRNGRLTGYLIGEVTIPSPTSMFSQFIRPRSARVGYAGHAVEPAGGVETYRELYAALAPEWLQWGCFSHYVDLPWYNDIAREAWFSLGFGDDIVAAVRDTGPVANAVTAPGLAFYRAGDEDVDVVMLLVRGLALHHASPPMYFPYLPEMEPDARRFQRELLADPAGAQFIAYRDGQPLALQTFTSSFMGEMLTPKGSIYLFQGYTEPEERGSGTATALLAHSLGWAREQGHSHCTLHYLSANIPGERFWRRHGFQPLEVRVFRQVDERIAWARAEQQAGERESAAR